ncbi:MAG: deoxyribose-phosphate aldolase [Bdellovibrio sp.]|nr:deoxyribose-phosphate aldolase [Bdellovibrio sp.]
MSLNSLVDQITDAVRESLVQLGVSPSTPPNWSQFLNRQKTTIQSPAGDGSLASKIDHTLLKPDATHAEIEKTCKEAIENRFATVCVNSTHIGQVAELLKGTSVLPIAVVGFPLGAASSASKAFETREAVKSGAKEIDMVIQIGALKSKDYAMVFADIVQVVEAAAPHPVKVILETSGLTQDEKIIGCALAKAAGAAFVKTSTGFGSGGATVEDVSLMRKIVGPEMGVKASGGIRTFEDANRMIAAGATRLGCSASVAIVNQAASGKKSETPQANGSY